MGARFLAVAIAVALTGAAALAGTPSAPLSLVFDKGTAAPHTVVVARTAGKGALLQLRKRGWLKRHRLRAYLVEASDADSVSSTGDERLVPLGQLKVDRKGNGRISFGVPNVPPGDYVTLLHGLPARASLRAVGPWDRPFRVVEGPIPVRTCERSVHGKLTEDFIARSPRIGPVRLIGYDPARAADPSWQGLFPNPTTGQYGVKVLLLVDRGPAATLQVAPEDRRAMALSYIPERFNRIRVTAGDAAVTFVPCSGNETVPWASEPRTQFNGSFVFSRLLCAHFEFHIEGRADPLRFSLPFGRPCAATQKAPARNGAIAFTRGGWIYAVSPNGGGPTRLVKGSNPAWSPDGSQLAFDRNYRLYVSDSSGQGAKKITDDAQGPAWSPDGKRIAFTGTEYPFSDCIPTAEYEVLWTIGADGSDRKLFTPKGVAQEICSVPGGDTDPSWAPGGKSIVFTHREYVVHNEYDERLIVAPPTGKPRRTIRAGAEPDWSPTEKSIAWIRKYKRTMQIFVGGPTASSKPRRLTTAPKGSSEPEWSPDGRKIVLVRSGALVVLDVKTGKARRVTSGTNDLAPSWRPVP